MILASTVELGPVSGPEGCLKFDTLHFLESTSNREGKAAITACEESALDPFLEQPKEVEVSHIDVDGDSGGALVAFKGSFFDGQKVRYAFIKRQGRWKFNEIVGFVDFDSAHLILQLGRYGMLKAQSPQEVRNVSCWIDRMERMSDAELQELFFGDSDVSPDCTAAESAI
ncbi:MAG: hypothetical protein ACTHNY_08670 [Solirubrobacterales bacterium]